MRRRIWIAAGAGAAAVALTTAGIVAATAGGAGDSQQPITGDALKQASEAALAETGGGRVTDTEVGDEDSYYEVEVTLDDGSQVDVQLNDTFEVVGSDVDHERSDDGEG
jgi:uncharacterized membrane protein YkoI